MVFIKIVYKFLYYERIMNIVTQLIFRETDKAGECVVWY